MGHSYIVLGRDDFRLGLFILINTFLIMYPNYVLIFISNDIVRGYPLVLYIYSIFILSICSQ
jgi:hypothetical protein